MDGCMNGSETWVLNKQQETAFHVKEMRVSAYH